MTNYIYIMLHVYIKICHYFHAGGSQGSPYTFLNVV